MRAAGHTHVGRVRARNEDAMGWDDRLGLAIVADGMGGHPCGDVAARLAVDAALETARRGAAGGPWLDSGGDPARLLTLLNATVLAHGRHHPECTGLGATVVLAALGRDEVAVAHVGDARAYRLHAGQLKPLTRDHNLAGEAVARGWLSPEEARHTPERHQITQALGLDAEPQPEVQRFRRQPGDLLLLCSDGLTGERPDRELQDLLQDSGPDLETTARRMVHAALQAGGSDNITVVLVGV